MREIPEAVLDNARRLREEGASWESIGRCLGYDRDVLRYRVDPQYADRQRAKNRGPLSMLRAAPYRPSQDEVYRLLDRVPRDTRSFTGRAMGDPLPGRSALDQRRIPGTAHNIFDRKDSVPHIEDRHFNSEAV